MSEQTATLPLDAASESTSAAEERIAVATQLQLTWWRFKKHKLAYISGIIVILFYLMAIFADFLAYSDPHSTEAARSFIAPQAIHWFDFDGFYAEVRRVSRPHGVIAVWSYDLLRIYHLASFLFPPFPTNLSVIASKILHIFPNTFEKNIKTVEELKITFFKFVIQI